MITNFKLFENKLLKDPWSDFNLKQDKELNKLKNALEIEMFEGEEWVILHHLGSEKAYKPEIDYTNLLKEKTLEKHGGKVTINDIETIVNFINEKSYKKIEDKLDLHKFLTYPKGWDISHIEKNGLSMYLGYENFEDFIKNVEVDKNIETGLDPKYFGTHAATRYDQVQLPFDVTMFYIDTKDIEKQTGMQKHFIIRYPLKKLYPLYRDPLHLDYGEEKSSIKNIMINAREKGFDGTIVDWKEVNEELIFRVDIWKYIPISYIEEGEIKNTKYLKNYIGK